ncbi:hypothetical protein D3C81_2016920 [compost metagenome]
MTELRFISGQLFTAEITQFQAKLLCQFNQRRFVTLQIDAGQRLDFMTCNLVRRQRLIEQRQQRADGAAALATQADYKRRRCAVFSHAWY